MSQLYLFSGSLAAILVLAGIAWLLRLGGGGIDGEAQAMAEAEAILSGFEAERAIVGSDGKAAIVYGRDGSVALLKLHGTQVAARRMTAPVLREIEAGLLVDSGERCFGPVLIRGASQA